MIAINFYFIISNTVRQNDAPVDIEYQLILMACSGNMKGMVYHKRQSD